MVISLIVGVPIPFSFGIAILFLAFSLGIQTDALLPSGYSKIGSVVLLAIPLFILAGGIMEKGKIGSAITGLVNLFIGRIKGSLAYVTVISSALFGAISGSAAATLACIGSVAAQILYAWAGNQSVLACFLSTVIPGLILTFLLCLVSFFLLRKKDIAMSPKGTLKDWGKTVTWQSKRSLPALLMPVIVLGGIYGGIMTPTESAAVAVLYAIPVGMFVYKGLDWKSLQDAFLSTGTTTGVVMVMFFMVMIFSRILILQNVPSIIINFFTSISSNKIIVLLMINVFMIIIGMLMDDVSGILLCTPLLLPLVIKLGVHPVHFAAILGVNLGMGNITPPTAPLLYLGARVCNANVAEMLKPTIWLLLFAWFPTLLITTYVPEVALCLPKFILGGKF